MRGRTRPREPEVIDGVRVGGGTKVHGTLQKVVSRDLTRIGPGSGPVQRRSWRVLAPERLATLARIRPKAARAQVGTRGVKSGVSAPLRAARGAGRRGGPSTTSTGVYTRLRGRGVPAARRAASASIRARPEPAPTTTRGPSTPKVLGTFRLRSAALGPINTRVGRLI